MLLVLLEVLPGFSELADHAGLTVVAGVGQGGQAHQDDESEDCCPGWFHTCQCCPHVKGLAAFSVVVVTAVRASVPEQGNDFGIGPADMLSAPGYRAPPFRPPTV